SSHSTLPSGSLTGQVALVMRGGCTYVSKAERVQGAGGVAVVLVDNRAGEANFVPVLLPGGGGGMISDLDGANLRAFMDAYGGRTTFPSSSERDPHEIQTGRRGIVPSCSSAGPTNIDHKLKPNLA